MEFRSDGERLEAIRRSQERMKGPDGVDVEESVEKVIKVCEGTLRGGTVIFPMIRDLVVVSHPEYGTWQRFQFRRQETWEIGAHIRECDECQKSLDGVLKHLALYGRQS